MEIPGIFSQPIPTAGRSRKQWVAILVLSLGLGIGVYYFREPILNFAATAWTKLSTFFSGLVTLPFFGNLFAWMQLHPIETITAACSIIGFFITVGVTINKYIGKAQAAVAAQTQSQNTLTNYQNQFQDYVTAKETQIQQLQSQTSTKGLESLQSALGESQGLVTTQAQQIRSLQDQISALNNLIMLKETQVVEKIVVK